MQKNPLSDSCYSCHSPTRLQPCTSAAQPAMSLACTCPCRDNDDLCAPATAKTLWHRALQLHTCTCHHLCAITAKRSIAQPPGALRRRACARGVCSKYYDTPSRSSEAAHCWMFTRLGRLACNPGHTGANSDWITEPVITLTTSTAGLPNWWQHACYLRFE